MYYLLIMKMYNNDSPAITIHKTKPENKLSIAAERTSSVKVSGQIITTVLAVVYLREGSLGVVDPIRPSVMIHILI